MSTYAGTGVEESQDGFRTQATLRSAGPIARGPDGRIYFAQAFIPTFDTAGIGQSIRVIDSAGMVSTFAGSDEPGLVEGPRLSARFRGPNAIVFDRQGNMFVTDRINHRIRKIDLAGNVTTFAGSTAGFKDGVGTEAQFFWPIGMCIDRDDNLYVADFQNIVVRKITPQAVVTTYAGAPGERGRTDGFRTSARFESPGWVAISPNGELFVADWLNGLVRKIDGQGMVSTFASGKDYIEVVSVDPQGAVYISTPPTPGTHQFEKLDASGQKVWSLDNAVGFQDGPVSVAQFEHYSQPLFLPDGDILMAEGRRIRWISMSDSAPGCATPPPGLVAWWPGEGTAADVVGGNSGILHGAASFKPGKVGQSFSFDQPDSYLAVRAAPALNVGTAGGLTIESWINPSDVNAQHPIAEWNSGTAYGAHFYYSVIPPHGTGPGCLFANLVDQSGMDHWFTSGPGIIQPGKFQHVALTYDRASGTAALYVNGVLVSEQRLGSFVPQTSYDLLLGYRPPGFDGSPFSFTGQMDEVGLFNRALSAGEIGAIYTAGSAGKCGVIPFPGVTPLPGLAGYWSFDESSGSIAHDFLGVYDGTLSPSGAQFVPGGISGNAISFNQAANGFVSMGNVLGMASGDFSLVAWTKMNPGDTTEAYTLVSKQKAGIVNGYVLKVNANSFYGAAGKAWLYGSDLFEQEVRSTTSVNDGQWHQVVGVYRANGTKSIYVDGAPAEATNASHPIVPNSGALVIGGTDTGPGPGGQFNGLIDEVQLYTRALSDDEVNRLFQSPGQPSNRSGIVSTLAGSGSPGFQDASGLAAMFNAPNGGFVGPDQASYIADTGNHRIRRVHLATGQVTTVAGTGSQGTIDGPALSAQFNAPLGVCAEQTGTLLVADAGNNRVRKISLEQGLVSTAAGSGVRGYADGPALAAQFDWPNDLVVDAAGNIFISEFNNHTVRKLAGGMVTTFVGHGTPGVEDGLGTNAGLNQPAGLAVDRAGNLYITEWGSHRIRKVTPQGLVTTLAGSPLAGLQDGIGVEARFFQPDGIACDPFGVLFITEHGNHTVRRILPNGIVSTVAGTGSAGFEDGPAASAQFNAPGGLSIDAAGNLVIADTGNHRVRTINFRAGAQLSVKRSLPPFYSPGVKMTVQLETTSNGQSLGSAYAVEEFPPENWVVGKLSEGGVYDAVNRKVKFGPFFDSTLRVLTYEVTPPVGQTGAKTFRGLVSADGSELPVTGAVTSLPAPLHPADLRPADNRISINELTAYAGAWRKGQAWDIAPNPIPIDYVSRAGLLWKNGELYTFDPNLTTAPLWWINASATRPLGLQSLAASPVSESSALRALPRALLPGDTGRVRINVGPSATVSVYAAEEYLPAAVTVSAINENGEYDPGTRAIRWGPFFDSGPRELSYDATVQAGASGALEFHGVVSFDGSSKVIAGQKAVPLTVEFSALKQFANGDLGLVLGRVDGKLYRVEASIDLTSWAELGLVQNLDGILRFKDPIAWSHKFYRVAIP